MSKVQLEFLGKKSRDMDEPYAVFQAGDWEWRVLKTWQNDDAKDFARWFCAVSSPHTYGSSDLGDTYVRDVVLNSRLVEVEGRDPTQDEFEAVANLRMVVAGKVEPQ